MGQREGWIQRRRLLALGSALAIASVCWMLASTTGPQAFASNPPSAKHHPSPTPTPVPTPTTRPTLTPQPTPQPTPTPPPPTPPPTAPPTTAPDALPSAPAAIPQPAPTGGSFPYLGGTSADGSAQAIMINPTPEAASDLTSGAGPSDTQNLFWLLIMAMLAIPGLIVMTLIATVLIRR
jgi:outer membrane biosynthesis protein TonB